MRYHLFSILCLGVQQATTVGQRLANLSFPYSKLIVSTMTRAQQTASLINQELKFEGDKIFNTNLLREGAPFPPEPPLHHWKPDSKVFIYMGCTFFTK